MENEWRSRYEAFARLYKGRDDVIAERRGAEYVPVPGTGLTFERFVEHVRMEKTFAIYNKDNAGKVNFGLFDVDVLPRDQGWDKVLLSMGEKKRETLLIMHTLVEMGLERENMLIEFPTVGFHLLIFFDKPVSAKLLKMLMRFVLKRSGLEQIPFYPNKVDEPWGDRVQLPLRVNLNTARRSNFVRDLESFDPQNYPAKPDFSALVKIAPIDSKWLEAMTGRHGLS